MAKKINSSVSAIGVVYAGLILLCIGVLMPIAGLGYVVARWIFAAGALISLIGRFMNQYDGKSLRLKRLYRIEMWSSIFFCVAAFFMFYRGAGPTDWLAFTIAGGAILVYTSIMIPRVAKKEMKR